MEKLDFKNLSFYKNKRVLITGNTGFKGAWLSVLLDELGADVYGLADVNMTDDMKTYRQALRDLPSGKDTVAKCTNATWPTKP